MRTQTRSIVVEGISRVEGEGGLSIKIRGDKVTDVSLKIFEPPRMFEAFLVGRRYDEAPDITARICGICPIAYMLGASMAMESAFGVAATEEIDALRRLIYCGEWLESHGLHLHLLHAPDFLGYDDAVQMAADHPGIVERGLRLKKLGNDLMTTIGGREIHPVNLRVGGFYKAPKKQDLAKYRPELDWALKASMDVARWVGSLEFPEFEQDYEFLALREPSGYAIQKGSLASTTGVDAPLSAFEDLYHETHVERSTALHGHTKSGANYHVGPLARFAVNHDRLTPAAKAMAKELGLNRPCRNPFRSIVVRAIEMVLAVEEAIRLVDAYVPPDPPFVEAPIRAGRGWGCTEAPRGLCYHRYDLDERGLIVAAKIVPPTAQNLPTIEEDLRRFVPSRLNLSDDQLRWQCEQAIRNYDPCISCSTHAMRLRIDRAP